MNLEGLDGVVETLMSLPPELVSKRGGIVLKALRKGARIIQKHARSNLENNTRSPGKTGENWGTGFTAKKIITKRGRTPAGIKGEKVVITVRQEVHPSANRMRGKQIQANDIAFMMEYGTAKQEAEPWIRPAFNSQKEWATEVVGYELVSQLNKVVAKLAIKNKGK